MKKGDLVKGVNWICSDYGIGLVLATDNLETLKVYWPKENFWCMTMVKNVEKV